MQVGCEVGFQAQRLLLPPREHTYISSILSSPSLSPRPSLPFTHKATEIKREDGQNDRVGSRG